MTIFKTAAICLTLVCAAPAFAQTSINLGTINADPDAPVEVTSERLSIDQDTGTAIFTGDVVVGQGDMRLTAPRVEVIYDDVSGEITNMYASGGVTFVTATEAAESLSAEYNLDGETLVMLGEVLLTQGASAMSGDQLDIDLATSAAEMQGNVRTIFAQGDN